MKAEAFAKDVFVNQERKSEVRKRSDTVVVMTINNADWQSAGVGQSDPAGNPIKLDVFRFVPCYLPCDTERQRIAF